MRSFLSLFLGTFCFVVGAHADQSKQDAIKQAYQEFVQIDAQIENLVKQKLQLEGEVAQHTEREDSTLRPRVERRQSQQVQQLSQQIEALSQQIIELDKKRSSILENLNQSPK